MMSRLSCSLSVLLLSAIVAHADDWPQWRGPDRAGQYHEAGLLSSVPSGGLDVPWRLDCGYGYAGPAVADGKVYLFDYVKTAGTVKNLPSTRDELEGSERLRCIDAATGKELWTSDYERRYAVSYGGGPRCTPTIAGEYVYTLGTEGDLVCHRTSDGERVWHVNYRDEYGVETPIWGHSACPLVVGDQVICVVGGSDSLVVSFNAKTGKQNWTALSNNQPGYCGPVLYEQNGAQHLLVYHPSGVAGLSIESGEVLWSREMQGRFGMSIATPLQSGNRLFVTGYGASMLVELGQSFDENRVVWRGNQNNSVNASNATPYFTEDVIYGCDIESSSLTAVDPASGDRLWETREPTLADPNARRPRHGTAFLVRHAPSGKFLLFNESGELIVADLSREKYDELWRAKIVEPTSDAFGRPVVWSHPAYAEGCIFARNDKELVCARITE